MGVVLGLLAVSLACLGMLAALLRSTWARVRDESPYSSLAALILGLPLLALFAVVLVVLDPSLMSAAGAAVGLSASALGLYAAELSLLVLGLGGRPRGRKVGMRSGRPVRANAAPRQVVRRGREIAIGGSMLGGLAGIVATFQGVSVRDAWAVAMCGAAFSYLAGAGFVAFAQAHTL